MSQDTRNLVPIEDVLSQHGVCVINTSGISMHPLFRSGDAVNIKARDRRLKKYDVVLYKNPNGGYILHRVIGIKGDVCIIRGDNTFLKEYITEKDILGYMISYIKKGKVKRADSLGYRLYSRARHYSYPIRRVLRKIKSIFQIKKEH